MAEISDKDKLALKALIASTEEKKPVPPPYKPKPRPPVQGPPAPPKKPTLEDVLSGKISPGDANDMAMFKRNGGMIDRAAIRGKTKGKIC